MSEIESLTKTAVKFRDDRDWKQFHNPKDCAISLALEAAELLEHFQWKTGDAVDAHIRDNKEEIADELSDVMYWVLLMANDLGIDIREAFLKKIEKSALKYPVEKSRGSNKKYTQL